MPTANQFDPTKQMPVVSPDGTTGAIPPEDWDNAQKQGFKRAVFATSPDGKLGVLHPEDVDAATKQGFAVGLPTHTAAPTPIKGSYAMRPEDLGITSLIPVSTVTPQPARNIVQKAVGVLMNPSDRAALQEQLQRTPEDGSGEAFAKGAGRMLVGAATMPYDLLKAPQNAQEQAVDDSAGFGAGRAALAVKRGVVDPAAAQLAKAQADYNTPGALPKISAGGHALAAAIPLVGPLAAGIGETAGSGDLLGAAGEGAMAAELPKLKEDAAFATSPLKEPVTALVGHATDLAQRAGGAIADSRPVQMASDAIQGARTAWNPEANLTPTQAATKAFRPRNSKANWNQEVQSALPDMKRAAEQRGVDVENMNLDDALKAANDAKRDVWNEYEQNHLGPAQHIEVPVQDVADAMRSTVKSRTAEQDPGLTNQIDKAASTYDQRTLPVEELQDRVSQLNNELRSVEAKYVTDKRAAKLDPSNAYKFAERDTLRSLLDDSLDQAGGEGGDLLRKRWGALNSVEDAISRRIPVAQRSNPISLTRIFQTLQGPGRIIRGLSGGGPADVAMGIFNTKAMMNAEKMNSPEWLTQQAFKKTTPRPVWMPRPVYEGEYVDPTTGKPTAGLLNPAPPVATNIRGELTQGGGFELPPASRIYGTPEETAQQVDITSGPPSRSVTPLGPTGKGGVLVRRLGLLPGTTEAPPEATPPAAPVEPSQPRGGLPFLRPKAASTPESTTAVASAETQGAEPTAPRTSEVSSSPEGYTGSDRRANVDLRKRVDQMTPEERAHALLTSEKTGLPNYRAFQESARPGKPAVGYLDLDDFHGVNSQMTHTGVDQVILPAVGDLFSRIAREEGVDLFHRSGDEFLARGASPEAVTKVFQRVQDELANATYEYQTPDGKLHVQKGIGASYGTGSDEVSAESAAAANKADRKAAGLRAGARDQAVSGEATPGQQAYPGDTRGQDLQQPGEVANPVQRVSTAKPVTQYQGRAAIEGSTGNKTTVLTPANAYPAQYRVVEAASLTPSHDAVTFARNPNYPEGVQERAYHTSKEAQNRVIQQAQNFNHAFVLNTDPTAGNGPSVITPDGTVLGGNSRAMTIQRLYRSGQGEAYRNALAGSASQFGISPNEINNMREPVLVREIQNPSTVDEARRIGSELNKPMTAALGVSERAVSAGKSFTPETLGQISDMVDGTDGGTLRDVMRERGRELVSMLTRDGIITDRERPQFIDTSTGGLSEEGKTFVERALLGSVVDDPVLMDRTPKSILNKIEGSLGDLSQLGARTDEYNILPLVRDALAEHAEIAQRGTTVDLHLDQTSMYGPPRNPAVDVLVRALVAKPKEVRTALRSFAQDANFDTPGQSTLGFGERPTPVGAFNAAFKANLSEGEFIDGLLNSLAKAAQPGGTITEAGSNVSNTATEENGARSSADRLQRQPTSPAPRGAAAGIPKDQTGAKPANQSSQAVSPSEPDLHRTHTVAFDGTFDKFKWRVEEDGKDARRSHPLRISRRRADRPLRQSGADVPADQNRRQRRH